MVQSHIDIIELSAESFQIMQDIVFRDVSEGMERNCLIFLVRCSSLRRFEDCAKDFGMKCELFVVVWW